MLIKCPSCNHDNQLGAIFCRNCGDKLDVETIKPKVMDNRASGGNIFGVIRKLISLLIFLGLVGVLVMMFVPGKDYSHALTEDQQEEAKTKFDELNRRLDGGFGKDVYRFTPAEATFLYNDAFVKSVSDEEGGTYNIERLSFNADGLGYVYLLLSTKLAGKIPTTFEVKGYLPAAEEGSENGSTVGFNVTKAKMGRMGMPGFANGKIEEKFAPTLDGSGIQKIIDGLAKLELDKERGEFVLTLKQ